MTSFIGKGWGYVEKGKNGKVGKFLRKIKFIKPTKHKL
jgi:hypothetical protein